MPYLPKISIITINFNDAPGLTKTMASVVTQDYPNMEYIVIDGGSTDGSVALLDGAHPQPTHWVSEKDGGIYDAMNKGAKAATGDWLLYMNAGDVFATDQIISKVFNDGHAPKDHFIYGDCIVIYEGYDTVRRASPLDSFWQAQPFSHQSVFIPRSYQITHPYDTPNRISGDLAFLSAAYYTGQPFAYQPYAFSKVSAGGVSDTLRRQSICEAYRISRRYRKGLGVHTYFAKYWLLNEIKTWLKAWLPASMLKSIRQRNPSA